jgi:hypothetical protein
MIPRIRHCVECPKCGTRYLLGHSQYGNGSYLAVQHLGRSEEYTMLLLRTAGHDYSMELE